MSVGSVHGQIRHAERPLNMAPHDAAAAPHQRRARARPRPPTRLSPVEVGEVCGCAGGGQLHEQRLGAFFLDHRRRLVQLAPPQVERAQRQSVRRARCLVPPARLMIPLASVSSGAASESDGTLNQNHVLLCPYVAIRSFRRRPAVDTAYSGQHRTAPTRPLDRVPRSGALAQPSLRQSTDSIRVN